MDSVLSSSLDGALMADLEYDLNSEEYDDEPSEIKRF